MTLDIEKNVTLEEMNTVVHSEISQQIRDTPPCLHRHENEN